MKKKVKPVVSVKYRLVKQDLQKIAKNALIFATPALLVFIDQLQKGVEIKVAINVFFLALYGIILDLAKKLLTETMY